jgi:hypothetical protein
MDQLKDGPVSSRFKALSFQGNMRWDELTLERGVSEEMARAVEHAPRGISAAWGLPFEVREPLLVKDGPVSVAVSGVQAEWLVFLHTSDSRPLEKNASGFISPMNGEGRLNEHAADYVIVYADGSEERVQVRRRIQIGAFQRRWGENIFGGVAAHKPFPMRASKVEQPWQIWGITQTRAWYPDAQEWTNWLWAWQNPHPEKAISDLRFEAVCGVIVISAISAGNVQAPPLRWRTRRKALLKLPQGLAFDPRLDGDGLLAQVQLDMGQVISARKRTVYPAEDWADSYNNQPPQLSETEILIEYTSHPEASFHFWDESVLPAAVVENHQGDGRLEPVSPAARRVTLKVVEKHSGRQVAAKLHVHGLSGERLAPVDRHRIVNPYWFEDYSADFINGWVHECTYISGETTIDLPPGKVFVEVSKGFEIRPLRQVVEMGPETSEVVVEVEKVLPWRERGWVTADTHVHFLSPGTAMLEGAAEGVNVVNLLASQWGELMTNVGDFDGRTTWGRMETDKGPEENGEYLVRVGTENRQHVLGHISLLGYKGKIIAPMTSGGPDESALGDPIEILLTEWARQCKRQGGLVVLPHFPNPRAEHAASIISGDIDAVEMTSWGNLYGGIDPYSMSDWYRYLNCGYRLAAVAGTDKMTADTAVGTVRTYAHLPAGQPFTYEAWMEAVRRAETFATYGPLLEFMVDGRTMGSRISLTRSGGTLDVTWQVASVTVPVTRVELVVNGEIRESSTTGAEGGSGSWKLRVDRSVWVALLVRGKYPDREEIIAAHSSPVMVDVEGSPLLAAADALTILEQIEGAMAYIDTIGTRAEEQAYKRMRLVLEAAHCSLHNRMHMMGFFHEHSPVSDHPEHHA